MQVIKRNSIILLFLLWAACLYVLPVKAEASKALWAALDGSSAVLYLPDSAQINGAQVGTVPCTGLSSTPITELETPIHTLIILDNSLSIPTDDRPVISQLLTNLIGNRLQGETFTIATIEDEIHYLCTDESDYLTLSSVIDGLVYENQDTQLTDNIYTAIQSLHSSLPLQFSRVLIISDGVDDKEIGYTRAELEKLIADCGYPIYTVGCGGNDTAERKAKLESLFALSRIAGGASFYLGETDSTYTIAQGIAAFNTAQQVVVPLPAEVCDGTQRAIMVQTASGEYTAELTMPFAAAQPESAASEPEPVVEEESVAEPEPEPEPKLSFSWIWDTYRTYIIIGLGVLLFVLVLSIALFLRSRAKKKASAEPERPRVKNASEIIEIRDGESSSDSKIRHWYDDLEQYRSPASGEGEGTLRVFNGQSAGQKALRLTSMPDGRSVFEQHLVSKLTAGRSSSCNIVLEFPSVSRQQCEFFQQGGQIYVQNLSRTNITQVDGAPAQSPRILHNGSILKLGDIIMKAEIL